MISNLIKMTGLCQIQWRICEKRDVIITTLFGLGSGFLYYFLAQNYQTIVGFHFDDNIYFGLDQLDAFAGWVTNHKGIHPLLLFIVVPLSNLLAFFTGSYESGLMVFCGLIGGLTSAGFYLLLRLILSRHPSIILNSFFILSMNQLFFAALADTYELVAFSLILIFILMILCLKNQKLYFPIWLIAGLFAFSITITSAIQVAICFSVVLFSLKDRCLALEKLIVFPITILVLGFVLSLFQVWIFPGAQHFFQPDVYNHEMQYVKPHILTHPIQTIIEIFKSIFIYSFIGQDPKIVSFKPGVHVMMVYYKTITSFGWFGILSIVLWLIIFFRGIFFNLKDKSNQFIFWTSAIGTLSNLVLFSIFNTEEIYLYSPHFSFITILLMVHPHVFKGRLPLIAGWVLLVFLAINNFGVQSRLMDKYRVENHNTIINKGEMWRYFPGVENPGESWTSLDYDDSSWQNGPSGFGYGDGDDATKLPDMQGNYSTLYIRKSFSIQNSANISKLIIDLKYDDGFVLFLNDRLVLKEYSPSQLEFNSLATGDHSADVTERFICSSSHLIEGENIIAIMVLNWSINSSDLTMIPVLHTKNVAD